MKTASVRELRQDFPRLLEWINAGEEIAITKRNRAVARLVPYKQRRVHKKLPDIGARLKRVFGRKVISDKAMRNILDESRGAF